MVGNSRFIPTLAPGSTWKLIPVPEIVSDGPEKRLRCVTPHMTFRDTTAEGSEHPVRCSFFCDVY